ncbi:MAG: CBS domain-containing protein, partial [Bacteroidetes bacterium]|nr:CBS domain-containing protein [Bacteroidota bacterium]
CNDNPDVFNDIKEIRKISNTPVDLHLITNNPENYYSLIDECKIENVTFQFEKIEHDIVVPEYIKSNLGLSIVSETDIEIFEKFKDRFSFILFMATTPGESGGKFNKQNFKKIGSFRNKYPGKKIHVDGGVNEELSFILRNMGVDVVVIGSYLFKTDFIGSALLQLKSDDVEGHYKVKDFMMDYEETPMLNAASSSFYDVLKSIDNYKMGFTTIIDDSGIMQGIITNADIRKSMIRNYENIKNISIDDMINRNPAYIYDYETVSEMLSFIKSLDFPVLFMPVLDENKKLVGVIKFNNLIKGES